MDSRKIVFKETAIVAVGEVLGIGVMLGIYALLHRFSGRVAYSAALGGVLALLNFFLMAVGTSLAADKAEAQNVKGRTSRHSDLLSPAAGGIGGHSLCLRQKRVF